MSTRDERITVASLGLLAFLLSPPAVFIAYCLLFSIFVFPYWAVMKHIVEKRER